MFLLLRYLIIGILLKFCFSNTTNTLCQVSGRVSINKTAALKNGLVTLASDSLMIRLTKTDEKGYFSFNKLPKANYRLLIVINGYEKYTSGFFTLTSAQPIRDLGLIELKPIKVRTDSVKRM
ncbi:MAG: carboxypeptidase regulatory-like domain-containing protein [Pedobacter sp.]|nr:MAG: carboxypeptidase regulatory-like domain-containing protein [Pedobacter sp.]